MRSCCITVVALLSLGVPVYTFSPRPVSSLRPYASWISSPKKVVLHQTSLSEAEEGTDENAVQMIDVEVSDFDEFLIKYGVKDDPRIPEDCRVDTMTKVKNAGTAGIVSYALTELAFWVISVPLAIASVAAATGSLPDLGSQEGQAATGAYILGFLTFARAIVPVRIALALAGVPWVDENIMIRFKKTEEDCAVEE